MDACDADIGEVSIHRDGQRLILCPLSHKLRHRLRRLLRTLRHDLVQTDGGYGFGAELEELTATASSSLTSDGLWVPAGLELVMRQWLARQGISCVSELPAPLPVPANCAAVLDQAVIDLIREHVRGLIRHGPGVRVDQLVAQIALAWPHLRIGVAAARIKDARDLRRRLADCLGEPVSLTTGQHTVRIDPCTGLPERHRVIIGTYRALASHPGYPHLDIVIAAGAVEATAKQPWERLHGSGHARLYGLLATDRPVAPAERDLMWCLFGFEQRTIPAHGYHHRPVEVNRMPITGGPQIALHADMLELKRQGIWHHPVRNRHIARAARLLANGDRQALAAQYPGLAAIDWLPMPARVLVLVEGIDHALALAERLPGWPVMTGPLTTSGLPRDQVRRLQVVGPAFGSPHGAIVTASARDAHRLSSDVVIRADGGLGLPTLPGLDLSCGDQPLRLLLIDLADRHHPELRRRSRARLEAYAAAGWYLARRAPHYRELELFESTRPKWWRP